MDSFIPQLNLMTIIDLAGIAVFVMTGCLTAAQKRVDIIGFILLGTVTGIGGGTLRDMLLGHTPVFWVHEPMYLWVCLITGFVMFWTGRFLHHSRRALIWGDAIGLAIFAVQGCRMTLESGMPPVVAILMGVMTASFGGIIRDLLAGDKTLVFRREIYVTAAALGAVAYWALLSAGMPAEAAFWAATFAAFSLRAVAIVKRLSFPGYGTRSGNILRATDMRRTK